MAALEGDQAGILQALQAGANLDTRGWVLQKDGLWFRTFRGTALKAALYNNHLGLALELVRMGANVDEDALSFFARKACSWRFRHPASSFDPIMRLGEVISVNLAKQGKAWSIDPPFTRFTLIADEIERELPDFFKHLVETQFPIFEQFQLEQSLPQAPPDAPKPPRSKRL